jgi:adenylate cyclase, class 2
VQWVDSEDVSRNIELKAWCTDLDGAQRTARELGAELHAAERQEDTYFHVPRGRLKLRRRWIDDRELPSELIWYERPDTREPRGSDYSLAVVERGAELRALLGSALGVRAVVEKLRTVYLLDNVRIHLDQVAGLGTFLEFEAIVDGTCDDAAASAKLKRLRTAFGVALQQVVARSYGDILGQTVPLV